MKTIAYVAGKSGGHILPCLAHAQKEYHQDPTVNIIFFATNNKLDKKILSPQKWLSHIYYLTIDNIPYKKWYLLPIFILKCLYAWCIIFKVLYQKKPTKIVSMGGFVSIPVCITAKMLQIPVELYELNVIPGKTTQFLAPFVQKLFFCFPHTQQYFPKKIGLLTHYPIRFSKTLNKQFTETIQQKNNFQKNRITILLLGGSQGSLFLNKLLYQWLQLNQTLFTSVQIIHQTGNQDKTDSQKMYADYAIPAIVFDFTDQIDYYYEIADIIVCRSGAGTLFEIVHFNKRCITIPLESTTTTHQRNNAYAMAEMHPQLIHVLEQKKIEENANLFNELLNKFIE